MDIRDLLHTWTEEAIVDTDLFIVEIQQSGKKYVVLLDSENNFSVEDCVIVSRKLEAHLDVAEGVPEDYTIEVSSPGVGKPLSHPRQFPKNLGRLLSFLKEDNTRVEGRLINITQHAYMIEQEIPKQKFLGQSELLKEEVIEAKVLVEFK